MMPVPPFVRMLFVSAITVVVLTTVYLVAGSGSQSKALRGAVAVPPRDVSGLQLPDAGGTMQSFAAPSGELRIVYFGYTSCPDVCPTTLSDLRTALGDIGGDARRVGIAMVTIDPERDNAPLLSNYLHQFFPGDKALALRTDDQTLLQAVTKAFGAAYEVKPATTPGGQPDVSHTAWLYAVDDRGRIVDQWSFPTKSKDITHDLRILLD